MQAAVRSLAHSARELQLRRPLRHRRPLLTAAAPLVSHSSLYPSSHSRSLSSRSPSSVLPPAYSCPVSSPSLANCCARLPRLNSNFPALSSAAVRQQSRTSAPAQPQQDGTSVISQALGSSTSLASKKFTSSSFSPEHVYSIASVPVFIRQSESAVRSPVVRRYSKFYSALSCSSTTTTPLTSSSITYHTSATPKLTTFAFNSRFHTSQATRLRPHPFSLSFSQKHSFQNGHQSTRQQSESSDGGRLGLYAGTSFSLILLGAYSVSEADSTSSGFLEFPANLVGLNYRSLNDWWPASPEKPANSAPPRAPRNPIFLTEDMASKLPGRPETLTVEQEAKLKEFWNATLKLFAQSATDVDEELAEETSQLNIETPDSQLTRTNSEEVSKKKRRLFGRSKKDKEKKEKDKDKDLASSSNAPTPPPGAGLDPEDKYNQGKDFKAALASQTPEQLRATFWGFVKYDNPDGLLLRFLRARKWDVEKALVMMVSTMHWRGQEVFVENIVKEGELHSLSTAGTDKNAEGFMHQLRIGKSYVHGVDKDDRPVCIVSTRLHKASDQTQESLESYTIYLIETTRLLLKQPVDTACILFDMTGFGMANMDYTPVKFMIKCFEAHYPECLGVCIVHNAPWLFQGIWRIIKGWLDPVVASKVHFTSSSTDLAEFIEKSKLPKFLGGDEDWEYKYVEPVPGENASIDTPTAEETAEKVKLEGERWKIIEEYEKNTRQWIKEESKGAATATDAKDERSDLRERLKGNYWQLDKHYRAKTYYDRVGMIGKNGEVEFYPADAKGEVNGNGNGTHVPAHTSDADLD